MNTAVLEFHPVADLFPMMTEQEFDGLVSDIREHGLQEPVWLHQDGRIIDGRNRYRACLAADREPSFRTFGGPDSELVRFVVSLNVHRRHLNEAQRAMVAARIASRRVGRPSEIAEISAISQGQAAELLNVSRDSLTKANKVLDHAVPDVIDQVISGDIAVSTAALIADFDEATQQHLVGLEDKRQIRALAREIDMRDVGERLEMTAHVGHNSGDNEWYTPKEYIDAARAVMGDIDLDPATSAVANQTVQAAQFFDETADGLAQPWKGRVWMNPPYAQPLVDNFCARLVDCYRDGDVTEACVLVNNATETKWFQSLAAAASAICFPRGRVRFWHPTKIAVPLQGQAVVYLGPNGERFREAFAFGFVAVP